MTLRVMHVDDEPDIRDVVEMSLRLDPGLELRSCSSGPDALNQVEDWAPDLILLDVIMPVMDGPTTLARLRKTPQASEIPVVFMTARAQTHELERFRSLGVAGVIAKPFDPMTLAASVRSYLKATRMNALRCNFQERSRSDARALKERRTALSGPDREDTLKAIKPIAHGLAGSAGIYGFNELSRAAAAVETDIDRALAGEDVPGLVSAFDRLLACIEES